MDKEIILTYTRQERSKDSNGSKNIFIVKNNIITHTETNWGFKAKNNPKENYTHNLSEESLIEIWDFLEENKLLKNRNKKIRTPRVPYIIYTIELKIISEKNNYSITVQGSNKKKNSPLFEKVYNFYSLLKLQ